MEELRTLYNYRIVKFRNALGKTRHRAEYSKPLTLFQRIKRWKPDWKIVYTTYLDQRDMNEKEQLKFAQEQIQDHKANNTWIEEIIIFE